jgi:hypothetical protein
VAVATLLSFQNGWAAAVRIPHQSASATGQAEAFTAQADDASAIYYNPAGLTQLASTEIMAGGYGWFPEIKRENSTGSVEMNSPALIPHFFAASNLGLSQWCFGVGVNSVFGTGVDWGKNSPFRYLVTDARLTVLNIAPTVVKAMIDLCHKNNLPVIYHGCGNVHAILTDFIEMGLDAYNPLEAKADLDVCQLRSEYGHKLGFCGNSDIRVWERGDPAEVRREVFHRLQAARGGGMIFQSDHSVASDVSGKTYDLIVSLVRQYGRYPIEVGELVKAR